MVVTRRAPAPPVPTSRTNSAQPISRAKGKAPHTVPDVPSPLGNGASRADHVTGVDNAGLSPDEALTVSLKKGKGKQKGKKSKEKKSKKKTSFTEFLTRIFLLWFTIYTLSVCPNDEKLKSPICRGLYEYRRLILEPYLLPPVQHALSHPVIAPYVDRAKPVVNRAIAITTPIAIRAHHEWTTKVVPQWDRFVVPQWQRHVVPQWKQHVIPHLERVEQKLQPYIIRVHLAYERRVEPRLHIAAYNLHKFQQHARPYVVLAAHKTYDGYQRAKPYAIPVLHKLQLLLVRISQFLGEKRRQFVDPHVKRIWERVNELSRGDVRPDADIRQGFTATSRPSSAPGSSEAPLDSSSLVPPTIISESDTPVAVPSTYSTGLEFVVPTPEVIQAIPTIDPAIGVSGASSAASAAVSIASSVTEKIASSVTSLASTASSVISDDTTSVASSIVEEPSSRSALSVSATLGSSASSVSGAASVPSTHGAASAQESVSSLLITASVVIDVAEPSTIVLDSAASDTASQIHDAPSVAPQDAEESEDDFLAKFYAELGLDQDLLNEKEDASEAEDAAPAAETETEEEKAEKLRRHKEEIAKKRADITGRHANWEKQLEERISQNRKALRKALVASRKAAVQELKENADIRREVEGLVEEAEKYLKGAEKYMGNLKRESRSDDEKRTIWNRVIEKVDKKFTERLMQTETVVNGWYLKVIEQEVQEVRRLAAEVKDIADRAQADIGLDYAWLDDVTYDDWQRYHDLERKSDGFAAQGYAIQNGTHPSPPINPVLPAIQDLQNEVQDIIVGFETRLRRIKRNGERAFNAAADDTANHDGHDASSDETVSILPIKDDVREGLQEGELPAVPPIVIGRSKEEILSALDRAAQFEARATSASRGKSPEPEQVVERLAQEAEAEDLPISSPVASHQEL